MKIITLIDLDDYVGREVSAVCSMDADDTYYLLTVRGSSKIYVIDRQAKKIQDLFYQNPSNDTNIEKIKVLAVD